MIADLHSTRVIDSAYLGDLITNKGETSFEVVKHRQAFVELVVNEWDMGLQCAFLCTLRASLRSAAVSYHTQPSTVLGTYLYRNKSLAQ